MSTQRNDISKSQNIAISATQPDLGLFKKITQSTYPARIREIKIVDQFGEDEFEDSLIQESKQEVKKKNFLEKSNLCSSHRQLYVAPVSQKVLDLDDLMETRNNILTKCMNEKDQQKFRKTLDNEIKRLNN